MTVPGGSSRLRTGPLVPAILAWAAMISVPDAHAQGTLANVDPGDPLEIARTVERLGDEPVLRGLMDDTDLMARLAAIRAAAFLAAPELALGPLADLAGKQDPLLAPEAARALTQIAQGLRADDLQRREVLPADLADPIAALTALADREGVRPDIRACARFALSFLWDLSGAPPQAPPPGDETPQP